ncbi:MAG: nucleotidyltransferase family protein [Rubrobacter sp.]|jgi:predicted nucleotidyltransferase|nr:nucleotidyltransferase family protein [Rubrobacter sp.]
MRREEATRIIAEHRDELKKRGVKHIYLFGSTARDEAGPESDVDVLIEVDHKDHHFGLFQQVELQSYLEQILGQAVDVGTVDSLKPQLKKRILEERVFVA